MTVSDITRSKYECIIRRQHLTGIWTYVCRRKDMKAALIIPYHRESKSLAPPMLHLHCKTLDEADSNCRCQFIESLCHAEPWAFMNWSQFKAAHNGQFEPPPAFWDLMIEAIELRRIPEESTHEAL